MKDEALDLALEALEYKAHGPVSGEKDLTDRAITAIKQARALDKKAENARELGLDYEPADGTQVSKVWWDGEKLMAKPIPLEDIYQPVQDSTCNETLRAQDKAYPRTCKKCGKGPCIGAPKQPPAAQPAPVQEPVGEVKDLFTQAAWEKLDVRGSTKVYLGTPPAAPVQEPVAWARYPRYTGSIQKAEIVFTKPEGKDWLELYTTPPGGRQSEDCLTAAQRQWVGLTDAEVMQTMSGDWTSQFYFARAIEAKLKEKNDAAQPPVPDALNPKDENPAYAAGWNDCRAEMLKGMKP